MAYADLRYYGREKKKAQFDSFSTILESPEGYRRGRHVFAPSVQSPRHSDDVVLITLTDGFERSLPLGVFESSAPRPDDRRASVRARFDQLRKEWANASALLGSPTEMFMHPAYQQIIGLGPDALPLILESLRDEPDHWFWALVAIAGRDAATGKTSFKEARAAWLEWGVDQGHLT